MTALLGVAAAHRLRLAGCTLQLRLVNRARTVHGTAAALGITMQQPSGRELSAGRAMTLAVTRARKVLEVRNLGVAVMGMLFWAARC